MVSSAWKRRLSSEPDDVKQNAASALLGVQSAIRTLENAQLANLRDKLVENEADLRAGIDDLNDAKDRLEQVQSVLAGVGKVLVVVTKVAGLAVPT
jgi:hypothetical protein